MCPAHATLGKGEQPNKCNLSVLQVQLLSILISLVLKVVPAGETAECNQSSTKPIRGRIGAGRGRSFTQGDNILKRVEAWRRRGRRGPFAFPVPTWPRADAHHGAWREDDGGTVTAATAWVRLTDTEGDREEGRE